jgi:hypothetical protein
LDNSTQRTSTKTGSHQQGFTATDSNNYESTLVKEQHQKLVEQAAVDLEGFDVNIKNRSIKEMIAPIGKRPKAPQETSRLEQKFRA